MTTTDLARLLRAALWGGSLLFLRMVASAVEAVPTSFLAFGAF